MKKHDIPLGETKPSESFQELSERHSEKHHNLNASETFFEWFRRLHILVQIILIICTTTLFILILLNPVAGGVLTSYLLALRGVKYSLPSNQGTFIS